jgi:2'-5' RNA ligase
MSTLRLFIAIETPQPIISQIAEIQAKLKKSGADVRWENPAKFHATMKFLGNTDEKLLPEIVTYTMGVAREAAPLQLRYVGLGCFPNNRNPRVIWTGIEDLKGNLAPLQEAVESALVPLGFQYEERRFHAHVTLGRLKSQAGIGSLLRVMDSITFESQPVIIKEISLVKSELKPTGSVYTTLKLIPLHA